MPPLMEMNIKAKKEIVKAPSFAPSPLEPFDWKNRIPLIDGKLNFADPAYMSRDGRQIFIKKEYGPGLIEGKIFGYLGVVIWNEAGLFCGTYTHGVQWPNGHEGPTGTNVAYRLPKTFETSARAWMWYIDEEKELRFRPKGSAGAWLPYPSGESVANFSQHFLLFEFIRG